MPAVALPCATGLRPPAHTHQSRSSCAKARHVQSMRPVAIGLRGDHADPIRCKGRPPNRGPGALHTKHRVRGRSGLACSAGIDRARRAVGARIRGGPSDALHRVLECALRKIPFTLHGCGLPHLVHGHPHGGDGTGHGLALCPDAIGIAGAVSLQMDGHETFLSRSMALLKMHGGKGGRKWPATLPRSHHKIAIRSMNEGFRACDAYPRRAESCAA